VAADRLETTIKTSRDMHKITRTSYFMPGRIIIKRTAHSGTCT